MRGVIKKAAALAGAALLFSTAASAAPKLAAFASIGPETSVPYGWLDFCRRNAGECAETETPVRDIEPTAKALEDIEGVNALVNRMIEPASDIEHYGVADFWSYPVDGKGDCEDYALLKRKMLIEKGYPRQALLVTVVKDRNGEGHAVLTVKTTAGEFVLDNLADAVTPWAKTGYRFVKRQSQENQNLWVAIGDPVSEPIYVSRRGASAAPQPSR